MLQEHGILRFLCHINNTNHHIATQHSTMSLFLHAVQILAIYVVTRVVWLVVRPLVRKDALSALPTPSGGSPFIGE
jgi:hypothetical protein